MKKFFFFILFILAGAPVWAAPQIVIDHRSVDEFNSIPDSYIEQIKSNRLIFHYVGHSHSRDVEFGLKLLESQNSKYASQSSTSPVDFVTENALRHLNGRYITQFNQWNWGAGEDSYWHTEAGWLITEDTALNMKSRGLPLVFSVWGWSWHICSEIWWEKLFGDADMAMYTNGLAHLNGNTALDPAQFVYNTSVIDCGSFQNPDGQFRTTYYNNVIRKAASDSGGILFDSADIENWNNANTAQNIQTDDFGRTIYLRHDDYDESTVRPGPGDTYDLDHANDALGIRKAKALWVLMAKLAGWPGTINTALNHPPSVSAGHDQTVARPNSVTLAGLVSDDGNPSGNLTHAWTQSAGPATINLINAAQLSMTVSFPMDGTYVFRLTGSDGMNTASDEVAITVNSGIPPGDEFVVNAGADFSSEPSQTPSLGGVVTLGGNPVAPADGTFAWSRTSGPGSATFENPALLNTSVSFGALGVYILRLTASDGTHSGFDEIQVTVNDRPVVNAGPDQTTPAGRSILLSGSATDAYMINSSLSYLWAAVAGPGNLDQNVAIGMRTEEETTITFFEPGTYTLRLRVFDGGLFNTDDVMVTVTPDESLVLHLDFNSNFTLGMAPDQSSYGNNATCQNNGFYVNNDPQGTFVNVNQCPVVSAGPDGTQAANFRGSTCLVDGDYFGLTKKPELDHMVQGTLSVWVNYNSKTDPSYSVPMTSFNHQRVFDTRTYMVPHTWAIEKNYTAQTRLTLETGGSPRDLLVFPDGDSTGVWNHYAITWNAATAQAYFNGVLVQTANKSDIPSFILSNYITIGAMKHNPDRNTQTFNCGGRPGQDGQYESALRYYYDHNYPGYSVADGWTSFTDLSDNKKFVMPNAGFLNGQLDELRVYNRPLSAEDILALYRHQNVNPGGPTNPPNPPSTSPSSPTKFGRFKTVFKPADNSTLIIALERGTDPVSLFIFDRKGNKVKTLIDSSVPIRDSTWDGRNDKGEVVSSGVYILQLRTGDQAEIKKIVVVK